MTAPSLPELLRCAAIAGAAVFFLVMLFLALGPMLRSARRLSEDPEGDAQRDALARKGILPTEGKD